MQVHCPPGTHWQWFLKKRRGRHYVISPVLTFIIDLVCCAKSNCTAFFDFAVSPATFVAKSFLSLLSLRCLYGKAGQIGSMTQTSDILPRNKCFLSWKHWLNLPLLPTCFLCLPVSVCVFFSELVVPHLSTKTLTMSLCSAPVPSHLISSWPLPPQLLLIGLLDFLYSQQFNVSQVRLRKPQLLVLVYLPFLLIYYGFLVCLIFQILGTCVTLYPSVT